MMQTRRTFVRGAVSAAVASAFAGRGNAWTVAAPLACANLLQLGTNMWNDRKTSAALRCDDRVWEHLTARMAEIGMNMLVIDLAEGLEYPSHPELAVRGSWSPDRMKRELARLRKLGIEPVPKLNFSTCHDIWLGDYSRMVSTPPYYKVVEDLIRDTCEIFGRPRFFHIGMDEETYRVQREYAYVVCRQGELWYRDLDFYRRTVERYGARAMMWSDQAWSEPPFAEKVAKSIVQNNWYYWNDVPALEAKSLLPRPADEKKTDDAMYEWSHLQQLRAFRELDAAGFDQMPCATNWNNRENMDQVVDYALKHIAREHLLGFLFTPWELTLSEEKAMKKHEELLELVSPLVKRLRSVRRG